MTSSIQNIIHSNSNYSSNRIFALYKDFSDAKHLNPEGYDANITAWNSILIDLLKKDGFPDGKLSLSKLTPDLSKRLTLPIIGKPLYINQTVDELIERRHFIPLSLFMGYNLNIETYIKGDDVLDYLRPSVWRQRAWDMSYFVRSALVGTNDERYISWDYLYEFTDEFVSILHKLHTNVIYSNTVWSFDHVLVFIHENATPNFTRMDLNILLKHLSRDRNQCSVLDTEEGTFIKFANTNVTEEDKGIAMLKWNIYQMSNRANTMETEINNNNEFLKQLSFELIKKHESVRHKAKLLLTTRKRLENAYKSTLTTLDQLNEVLLKMDDATTNVDIVKAFDKSSRVLKVLNDKVSLDDVDEMYSDLHENIGKTDEITDALNMNDLRQEDEEVEKEYQQLLDSVDKEIGESVKEKGDSVQEKGDSVQEKGDNTGTEKSDNVDTENLINKLLELKVDSKIQQNDQPKSKEAIAE